MSYDVDVADQSFNMTSNLRQFFKEYDAYPPDFHGQIADGIADLIDAALSQIVLEPVSLLSGFDAPNGWGRWEQGVKFLMGVRDACRKHPDQLVEVSY